MRRCGIMNHITDHNIYEYQEEEFAALDLTLFVSSPSSSPHLKRLEHDKIARNQSHVSPDTTVVCQSSYMSTRHSLLHKLSD